MTQTPMFTSALRGVSLCTVLSPNTEAVMLRMQTEKALSDKTGSTKTGFSDNSKQNAQDKTNVVDIVDMKTPDELLRRYEQKKLKILKLQQEYQLCLEAMTDVTQKCSTEKTSPRKQLRPILWNAYCLIWELQAFDSEQRAVRHFCDTIYSNPGFDAKLKKSLETYKEIYLCKANALDPSAEKKLAEHISLLEERLQKPKERFYVVNAITRSVTDLQKLKPKHELISWWANLCSSKSYWQKFFPYSSEDLKKNLSYTMYWLDMNEPGSIKSMDLEDLESVKTCILERLNEKEIPEDKEEEHFDPYAKFIVNATNAQWEELKKLPECDQTYLGRLQEMQRRFNARRNVFRQEDLTKDISIELKNMSSSPLQGLQKLIPRFYLPDARGGCGRVFFMDGENDLTTSDSGDGLVLKIDQRPKRGNSSDSLEQEATMTHLAYLQLLQRPTYREGQHVPAPRVHCSGTLRLGGLEYEFMVMQKIKGAELLDVLNKNQLAGKDVQKRRLIHKLFQFAKDFADCKMVHRDIKLANIMYDVETEAFCVVDFGFAKEFQDESATSRTSRDRDPSQQVMTSSLCGTPGYRAPELFERRVTRTTDLFAMVVTAFAMFTWASMPLISGQPSRIDLLRILPLLRKKVANAYPALFGSTISTNRLPSISQKSKKIKKDKKEKSRKLNLKLLEFLLDFRKLELSVICVMLPSPALRMQPEFLVDLWNPQGRPKSVTQHFATAVVKMQQTWEQTVQNLRNCKNCNMTIEAQLAQGSVSKLKYHLKASDVFWSENLNLKMSKEARKCVIRKERNKENISPNVVLM